MIFFKTHQRQKVCAWSPCKRHWVLLVDQQVLLAALHLGGEVKVRDNDNVTTGGEVVVEVDWRIDMRATGSKHVILQSSNQML